MKLVCPHHPTNPRVTGEAEWERPGELIAVMVRVRHRTIDFDQPPPDPTDPAAMHRAMKTIHKTETIAGTLPVDAHPTELGNCSKCGRPVIVSPARTAQALTAGNAYLLTEHPPTAETHTV